MYLHEGTAKPTPVVERTPSKIGTPALEPLSATADSRNTVPCRYFTDRKCINGSNCPYMHDPTMQADVPADPSPDATFLEVKESLVDDPHDDWTRAFSGAVVKFTDGASVDSLSLASDFSAVRLDNLPPKSTSDYIVQLLRELDLEASVDCVKVRQAADGKTSSADVKVEDPSFAAAVRDKLSMGSSGISVSRISVPMATGSGLHRIDRCKVHCYWHRPTCAVWLNFRTEEAARQVSDRFQSGVFKVKKQAVKANNPTGSNSTRYFNNRAWTVRLSDVDPTAAKTDVVKQIPKYWMPTHVELDTSAYADNAATIASAVKKKLLEIGPLNTWNVAETSSGKGAKAQARFENEEDAKTAESTLNNRTVAWLMNRTRRSSDSPAKLMVQHVTVAKIKIPTRIFNTLREPLDVQKERWSENRVYFVAYPPSNGHVVLKLEGSETKNVAEAYRTLSGMVKGIKLDVSKDAWCTVIQNRASWRDVLERIEKDHGITAVRDRRRCQLRLFGSTSGCEFASQLITAQLEKCVSKAVVIELEVNEFQWVCQGGFKELVAEFGPEKVTLDIVSNPKRILYSGGSPNDHVKIRALLARKNGLPLGADPPPSKGTPAGSTECSVCWTEAEEPVVKTSCGHAYCAGCFADLCGAEPTASTRYLVACVGGAATCKKALPLSDLKEHLSSAELEDVLEAAFTSHVRRHPSDFSYCPTPDCGRVYRITSSKKGGAAIAPTVFTCLGCFEDTCTSCQAASHPGLTCDESKDGSLAKLKAKLGIKDCSRCKTAMEKTEGCNHMTCRGCGAHICWVCMATFDTSCQCYDHLSKEHGGVFDVPEILW